MHPQELRNTLTFILAGGAGKRLQPLTAKRAKPAVPFGGAYRLIDFTLSNCIHSGLRRIYLLTQYQARSLEEHSRFGWNFLPRRLEQFIQVRPPHHLVTGSWYKGTADAIYRNLDTIEGDRPKYVMILSGDHVYKMDYGLMLDEHLRNKAALTIGTVMIPVAESPRFGILECDHNGKVLSFVEKPSSGKELPGHPGHCLGSMGIYIFEVEALSYHLRTDAQRENSTHDFGKDVIPQMIRDGSVYAHHYTYGGDLAPYWRDVGTLEAYFEANLDLCSVSPQLNLYESDWPIYTLWHNDPPAKTVFDEADGRRAEVVDSLVCPGSIVSGSKIRRSILSNRVMTNEHAVLEECILFRGSQVGRGARLRRTIVDKWTKIPAGTVIGHDPAEDRKRFTVTDAGIVVVPSRYDFG
jgi:glucose-1-phosphate adenylyltransferase